MKKKEFEEKREKYMIKKMKKNNIAEIFTRIVSMLFLEDSYC